MAGVKVFKRKIVEKIPPAAPLEADYGKFIGEIPTAAITEIAKLNPQDFIDEILIYGGCATTSSGMFGRADVPHLGSIEVYIEARHIEYLRSVVSEDKDEFRQVCYYSMKRAVFTAIYYEIVRSNCDINVPDWDAVGMDFCEFQLPASPDFETILPYEEDVIKPTTSVPPARLSAAVVVQLFGA
jgi:hypothetical protein